MSVCLSACLCVLIDGFACMCVFVCLPLFFLFYSHCFFLSLSVSLCLCHPPSSLCVISPVGLFKVRYWVQMISSSQTCYTLSLWLSLCLALYLIVSACLQSLNEHVCMHACMCVCVLVFCVYACVHTHACVLISYVYANTCVCVKCKCASA